MRPGLHVGEDRDASVTSCDVAINTPATSRTTNKTSQVRDETQ